MCVSLKGYIKDQIGMSRHDDMGQIFNVVLGELNENISPDDFNTVTERSVVNEVIARILNIDFRCVWLSKEVDDSKLEDIMEKSVLFDWNTPQKRMFDGIEYFLLEKFFTEEDAVVVYAKFKDLDIGN